MKKIKRIIAAIIGCFSLILLVACSNSSSGLSSSDVDMDITATKDKATIKLTLSENDNIKNGKAVLYITCYTVTDSTDSYHSKQTVSFSNSVYTSSTVTFSSLTANQEYKFTLFVTFGGSDSEVVSKTVTTSDTVSTTVSTADEFKTNLANDLDGEFSLTADIDFSGESISVFSSESKAFQGTLDGGIYDADGNLTGCHKISNFALTSASYIGLFGYLKNATIKNLIIEGVTADYTSRSTASIGCLAGYAVSSYVENVTINNFNLKISASSLAEHYTGGVVGQTDRCTFVDVTADNVTIAYSSARIKNTIGLFAGAINGEALVNSIAASGCGVKGSISLVAEYSSSADSTEYINVGGFAGSIGSNGQIDDCYTVSTITYSRKDTMARTFNLSIGGFVGTNTSNMYITNSLAVTSINAYAGALPTEGDGHDYSASKLASGTAYIGAFIGKATKVFRGIVESYAKESATRVVEALEYEDIDGVNNVYLYNGDFYGSAYDDSYMSSSSVITTEIPSNLSETLKALLA